MSDKYIMMLEYVKIYHEIQKIEGEGKKIDRIIVSPSLMNLFFYENVEHIAGYSYELEPDFNYYQFYIETKEEDEDDRD
jgi:hypothetical protein